MPRLSKIGAACLAAFGWTSGAAAVSASYLVVSGGGGGGFDRGGGGGAGGLLTGTATLNTTLSYTVTIGAGGLGSTAGATQASQGSSSVFNAITATGGGFGGNNLSATRNGGAGGSGGGGSGASAGNGGGGSGGAGTSGQGFAGGSGVTGQSGGGGGGASEVGNTDGNSEGGDGTASSITGTSVTYAGGGGGGSTTGYTNAGGTGGGGAGAQSGSGFAGTANLGGGGGGGGDTGTPLGGNGGSGVVIISYPSPQKFGGGIVTASGGNTIHTFTTSGTLSPLSTLTANTLVVAGGGGGGGGSSGSGGGGGAGGYRTSSGITIDLNSIYLVTVGSGGSASTGATAGGQGSNSFFLDVTSSGGGFGGYSTAGATGGSGGGSGNNGATLSTFAGAAGNTPSTSPSQGNNGGANFPSLSAWVAGGGGGAGAVGGAGSSGAAGVGGAGTASSISGSSVTYAGGGGGGAWLSGATGGTGGAGGGGNGGKGASSNGTAATANTGGGGGGGGQDGTGGAGGSGIVIISYPGSTQQMAGGTVTVAGGNVIHTFTSSGYLTPIVLTTNSLRFRSSASAYLSRTPASAGNRKTWTWSGWVKRGSLGSNQSLIGYIDNSAYPQHYIRFDSDNTLTFTREVNASPSLVAQIKTTQVFRDPSAWYHIVVVWDTPQATANNRMRMYVNGSEITAFSTRTNPTQNMDGDINNSIPTGIGASIPFGTAVNIFDGYLDEINFIDGQALTPSSFGTFNGLGVWQPIRYGGSYGTNGFYLPFNATVSANYLMIAGGGGGGRGGGGGGGAGGYLVGTTGLSTSTSYAVTVGAGGAGSTSGDTSSSPAGTSGTNSVFNAITATGGGGGGSRNPSSSEFDGKTGGSGGGGSCNNSGSPAGVGGTATPSPTQGNNGGNGSTGFGMGGGGGAGAVGANGSGGNGGNGGNGLASSITGTSVTRAGGGGGSGYVSVGGSAGAGGSGGGGNGTNAGGTGGAGDTNTGSGGGGGGVQDGGIRGNGGAGGSGVVIISYAGSARFSGGTITSAGGNTIHTFTSSGTLTGNIASDSSPNNNNWTTNNISLTLGTTYDSMTDVPTLTSTTAANYAVMNPLNNNTGVSWNIASFQAANLNVGSAATNQNVIAVATMAMTTGKFYWEVTIGSNFPTSHTLLGMTQSTATGITKSVGIYYRNDGQSIINGTNASYGASYTTGDVIGFAYDADTGVLTCYKNNSSQGGMFSSGAGSSWMPTMTADNAGSGVTYYNSFNFGQRPFAYTPPTGFLPLNTFNL